MARRVAQRVAPAVRAGECERAAHRLHAVHLAGHHVGPGRRERVLEVGHEDARARVERVDHHLPLDRSGDLDPAVGEVRRGSATAHSPSRTRRSPPESGQFAGLEPAPDLPPAPEQLAPPGLELPTSSARKSSAAGVSTRSAPAAGAPVVSIRWLKAGLSTCDLNAVLIGYTRTPRRSRARRQRNESIQPRLYSILASIRVDSRPCFSGSPPRARRSPPAVPASSPARPSRGARGRTVPRAPPPSARRQRGPTACRGCCRRCRP